MNGTTQPSPKPLVLELTGQSEAPRLVLHGALTAVSGPEILAMGRKSLRNGAERLQLDLREVSRYELGGLAVLERLRRDAAELGRTLELVNPPPELLRALESLPAPVTPTGRPEGVAVGILEVVGDHSERVLRGGIGALDFLAETFGWLVRPTRGRSRIRGGLTAEQMALMGADAVGIVCLIAFLIGCIMGLQSAYQLRQFGADIFIANLVGVAMIRELGPLMSAIVVSGRTGAAIAAELGTMVVSEEVDAMRSLGVSPTEALVVPRVAALVFVLPCLALLSDLAGIAGGMAIGVGLLELPPTAYWSQTLQALRLSDLMTGLLKASVFGLAISLTGCYRGLRVRGGAASVGSAATGAVVTSIFLTILLDGLFTALFYAFGA